MSYLLRNMFCYSGDCLSEIGGNNHKVPMNITSIMSHKNYIIRKNFSLFKKLKIKEKLNRTADP